MKEIATPFNIIAAVMMLAATIVTGIAFAHEGHSEPLLANSKSGMESPNSDLTEHPLAIPKMPQLAPGMTKLMGNNFWYLPYAVSNEQQGMAFVKAYRKALESGKKMSDTLKVPEGMGAGGSDHLYRLREGVSSTFIANINDPAATAVSQSEVPVVIAQPKPDDSGANVLYMDGHVKYVRWGHFPVTKRFLSALAKLDPPRYTDKFANG